MRKSSNSVLLPLLPLLFLFFATAADAATHEVPGVFGTIQLALDACAEGDTVLVADGAYTDSLQIDTSNIVLRATTLDPAGVTVDANGADNAVRCERAGWRDVSDS